MLAALASSKGLSRRPHALMSHVKPRRRNSPASPQTPERYRCDDRATVGAKPRDVGQHPLIRGFTHVRASVWGCPGLRTGVELACDRGDGDGLELASPDQRPVAPVQAALRLPGDLANRSRGGVNLRLLGWPHPRGMLIAPGALHQHAAGAPVAG